MQYRRMLLQQFPGVPVVGRQYPPGDTKILIATCAQYFFFVGIAVIFFGESIFKAMGMAAPPEWYQGIVQNKMQACMFLWVFNSLATGQLATNAFEVSYDGMPVFSKLETGRFPEPEELMKSLMIKGVGHGMRNDDDNSF